MRKRVATDSDGVPVEIPSSFEVFYREEYHAVLAIAYAITGDGSTAEELSQEAFLRAHRDWGNVSSLDVPSYWVRKVVINLSRSVLRRLRSEVSAIGLLGSRSSTISQPAAEVQELWSEVRRLPARQAEVIALRYVDDLRIVDIAELLDIAEGTVKALLHQGRRRLKRQLEAKGLLNEN